LTDAQWEECLEARRIAATAGLDLTLREIAVRKGFLSKDRVKTLGSSGPRKGRLPRIPGLAFEALVGRGAMGSVYRARQTALGRTVAVKLIASRFARSRRYVRRFMREARLAARLDHPNVVRVFLAGRAGERCYLVMEYVEGKPLSRLLKVRGPLPEDRAMAVVAQVAGALAQAHRVGILHRDIKPANILLTEEGTARLADLGLAKDLSDGDDLDEAGTTVGTASYMAPEQCRGDRLDARSDVYSLGATLYHMLAGRAPFAGRDRREIMRCQVEEPLPPLDEFNPNVSPRVVAILERMVAKNPAERYPSMEALLLDVNDYLRTTGSAADAGGHASRAPARPTWRRIRWGRVAIYLLATAALVVALVLYGPFRPSPADLLADAERLAAERERDRAAEAFGDLQRRFPDTPEGRRAAERLAELAREVQADEVFRAARAFQAQGQYRRALEACRRLATRFEDTRSAEKARRLAESVRASASRQSLERARTALQRKRWEECLAALTEAREFGASGDAVAVIESEALHGLWLSHARLALAAGRKAEALDFFRRALRKKPDPALAGKVEKLVVEVAARDLLDTLIPRIEKATPGSWAWTPAMLDRLRPAAAVIWGVVNSPKAAAIRCSHTRPELLLALSLMGDKRAPERLREMVTGKTDPHFVAEGEPEGRYAALALARAGAAHMPWLAAQLVKDDADVARWSAFALARLGRHAADVLLRQARAEDPDRARMCLEALGTMGDAGAGALTVMLDDPRPPRRERARDLLLAMGAKAVRGVLDAVPLLGKEGWKLALDVLSTVGGGALDQLVEARVRSGGKQRIIVSQAVGRIGAAAVPGLLGVVRRGPPEAQKAALDLLHGLGGRVVPPLLAVAAEKEPFPEAVRRALEALGERAIPGLMDAFDDADPKVRSTAERALLALGDRGLAALRDLATASRRRPEDRLRALDVLARRRTAAVPSLLALMGAEDERVAREAEKRLRALGPDAVPALRDALHNASWRVRHRALTLYWEAAGTAALPQVEAMLRDRSETVRLTAVDLVSRHGKEESVSRLVPLLNDKSSSVRGAVVAALARMGGAKAVEALVGTLASRKPLPGANLKQVIAGFGQEALPALRRALWSRSFRARRDVLDVLALIGGAPAIDLLIWTLDDKDLDLRLRAVEHLSALGGYRAVTALAKRTSDGQIPMRRAAVEALGEMGDRRVVPDIADRLRRDAAVSVRLEAVKALAKLGGVEARAALATAAQNDANETVRRAAALALRRLNR